MRDMLDKRLLSLVMTSLSDEVDGLEDDWIPVFHYLLGNDCGGASMKVDIDPGSVPQGSGCDLTVNLEIGLKPQDENCNLKIGLR